MSSKLINKSASSTEQDLSLKSISPRDQNDVFKENSKIRNQLEKSKSMNVNLHLKQQFMKNDIISLKNKIVGLSSYKL